jgi:hypothetical protein
LNQVSVEVVRPELVKDEVMCNWLILNRLEPYLT